MERQFNNGDFEKLLRDNANQYRMYPSEKVWKGIHSALHTRRRWYGLTAAIMLFITGSIVSIIVYNDNSSKDRLVNQKNISVQKSSQPEGIASAALNEIRPFNPAVENAEPGNSFTGLTKSFLNKNIFNTNIHNDLQNAGPITRNNSELVDGLDKTKVAPESDLTNNGITEQTLSNLIIDFTKVPKAETENINAIQENAISDQGSFNEDTEKKISDAISSLASENVILTKPKKQARVTAQVYFTPTVSYRKLTENKNAYNGSGFYVPTINVDNLVNHKPAMGLEFGIEGRYKLNKNNDKFSLKTGLQFNINRYDISAYSHPTEIATVALTSGYRVDSLASLSNYRNFSGNGNGANWLENFYFQVAIPVGAEIIISDRKNFQWGISGTLQPTYVIGDRAYVISSDYKNYAKYPELMRRWNISSGVGTFVSYSTGRIKWQAGPQVRYQHLSSFVSELTIKENLFAIGLKVGATLNNKK
jgi:hypothetical protein